MSKSVGNVIDPQKVMQTLGADIIRLWVSSTDYRGEMSVSDEILNRMSDSYRRIRNTLRFLLSNLSGFNPVTDLLPAEEMLALDRWVVDRALQLQQDIRKAYDDFQFHLIYHKLHNFCVVELGGFYLDIIKDRQYTTQPDSVARRSAQTALFHIAEAFTRWMAPILSFTAEEIWAQMPGRAHDSVFFATFADIEPLFAGLAVSVEETALIADLTALRGAALKRIEELRNEKKLGGSLEAEVDLYLDTASAARVAACRDELRFFFITSDVRVHDLGSAPAEALAASLGAAHAKLIVTPTEAAKCVRCWHHRADVGANVLHPELCGRCVSNVDGPGETRTSF